uniref:Uncharacterized protein n=1 Tax=Anopheles culicifacies TaxID=139723 RepID=A0A182MJU7_9DIPT
MADTAESNADGEGLEKQPPPPPDLACLPSTGQIPPEHQQQEHVIYVSRKDRNKFCGSLPNHLDLDASSIDRDCEAIVKQNVLSGCDGRKVWSHLRNLMNPRSEQLRQQSLVKQSCLCLSGSNAKSKPPPPPLPSPSLFPGVFPLPITTFGSLVGGPYLSSEMGASLAYGR